MLHSANELTNFSIIASDGELGSVDAVYFDDEKWTIRYFVVDTGRWLSGRKVLISPYSVQAIVWPDRSMQLNLTRGQIERSPDIDTDKPVSRQREAEFHAHFGYPDYWTGPFVWGATAFPETMEANMLQDADVRREIEQREQRQDASTDANPHLRSCKEVAGYRIRATDDAIGHVEDFLFDDESWTIQLIVVDPRNWWPGKHVMISPQRIDHIDWANQEVTVNLTRDEVENSPEYDSSDPPPSQTGYDLYRGDADRNASPPSSRY
jgi:uncharacterized protein YrrD